jgi:hypothetical protein
MLHTDDIVEEKATKRQGRLDEAPRIKTDVLRWRVLFSDGGDPPLKYFLKEEELLLIKCPHTDHEEASFVPERGIMG